MAPWMIFNIQGSFSMLKSFFTLLKTKDPTGGFHSDAVVEPPFMVP